MKKFLTFLMAFALLLGATSCTSCNKEKQKMENVVETVIKSDLNYMANNYGAFVWYETSLVLNDYLDAEDCTGTIESIVNIFQTQDTTTSPKAVMISHSGELMFVKEVEGYWCEDVVLDTAEITYTYRQAYERIMATDCIKPHSRYCVLREPLGPYQCNPQYIFGDAHGDILLFLDAVTGDVRNENPAFNPIE